MALFESALSVLRVNRTNAFSCDSVDGRGGSLVRGEHWSDADQLGTRAQMAVEGRWQGLTLNHLVEEDTGLYHCRVDFRAAPTRNLRIQLQVVGKWWGRGVMIGWLGGWVIGR